MQALDLPALPIGLPGRSVADLGVEPSFQAYETRSGAGPSAMCAYSGDGGIRTHTFSVLSGATPAVGLHHRFLECGIRSWECGIEDTSRPGSHSEFHIPRSALPKCPGWESNPHCPQGRPLYRRPGGPPRVRRRFPLPREWHGWESNPHPPRFELGRSAGWRTVPHPGVRGQETGVSMMPAGFPDSWHLSPE